MLGLGRKRDPAVREILCKQSRIISQTTGDKTKSESVGIVCR